MVEILEVTDQQITIAFMGANFGGEEKTPSGRKRLVVEAVFKAMVDYKNGNTMKCILEELGLISEKTGKVTKAARRWCYHEVNNQLYQCIKIGLDNKLNCSLSRSV